MRGRLTITSALMLSIAAPAFAECNQEIEGLNDAVTQAETGASSASTGLLATPHQEQVLAGKQQGVAAGQGAATQGNIPASPHQQQVLGGGPGGQEATDLIAEARDMAKAGDEEGCMQKVMQAKSALGID